MLDPGYGVCCLCAVCVLSMCEPRSLSSNQQNAADTWADNCMPRLPSGYLQKRLRTEKGESMICSISPRGAPNAKQLLSTTEDTSCAMQNRHFSRQVNIDNLYNTVACLAEVSREPGDQISGTLLASIWEGGIAGRREHGHGRLGAPLRHVPGKARVAIGAGSVAWPCALTSFPNQSCCCRILHDVLRA